MKKLKKAPTTTPNEVTFRDVEPWIIEVCGRYRKSIPMEEALSIGLTSFQKAYTTFDPNESNFMTWLKITIIGDLRNFRNSERKEAIKRSRLFERKKIATQRLAIDSFLLEASEDSRRLLQIIFTPKTKKEKTLIEELIPNKTIRKNVNPGKFLLRINEILKWNWERLYKTYLEISEFVHEG